MKFIASSPLTLELLKEWNRDIQILTHYFWRSGHEMQHNVKGLLLSLLHQSLVDRPDLSQNLWGKLGVNEKWSYSDWSDQEVESALCWTLNAAGKGFCIFIDGLDESHEIEEQLWAHNRNSTVLDKLENLRNVKICVSSREENSLCDYAGFQLRIHEFTKNDIHHFTNSCLEGLDFASESDRTRVVSEITSRAEGVFLWVVMVVKNVIRAFRINNDIELLIERVHHTPTNLKQLFQHMWERCGDDGDLESYRATASRYFNLAVAFQKHSLSFHRVGSLLCYAIAADNRPLDDMVEREQEVTLQKLHSRCLIAEKEIRVICNGLLELIDIDWYRSSEQGLESLGTFASKRVQFVHRCAADFFNDTTLGARLLDACGWSKEEPIARLLVTTLIRGRLTTARSVTWGAYEGSGDISYIEQRQDLTCIQSTFQVVLDPNVGVGPGCQDLIIKTLRQWQSANLFPDHLQWEYPGSSLFSSDPLELEVLEGATYGEDLSFVLQQVSKLPTEYFLDAVPVVMRGLASSCFSRMGLEAAARLNALTLPILKRLINLMEDSPTADALGSIKRTSRLLYSCYMTYFPIRCLEDEENLPIASSTSISAILRLFPLVLPDQHSWSLPMALYINPHELGRSTMGLDGRTKRWTCLVVVNFATAYRILVGWAQAASDESELAPEHINMVKDLIQPIVIKNEGYRAPESEAQDRISPPLQRWFAARSTLSEPEVELIRSIDMPLVADNEAKVLTYLIDRLGGREGLLVHPWAPEWRVRHSQ
ncbi:hypothetical protein FBEOM_4127 [Fusarium beomiforme]|uniref:NACHT domain-containing protein n=1 Tax=Fusarium beomiforme TaxID=44412 RepID=A0A9P5ANE4_9HYPO|nr:hypothetical protein FBEOM_4127 [Fusarium beomiforme]